MRGLLESMMVVTVLFAGPVFGKALPREHDYEMTENLGKPHREFTFAYSNFGRDGNLLRRFVLTRKSNDEPATLIDFHFEYLVEGQVRTFTLHDVGYVVPKDKGLDLYFYRLDTFGQDKARFDEDQFRKKAVHAILSSEIEKIRIEYGESPRVTTYFYDRNPRRTLLKATDPRTRFAKLYADSELSEVETFAMDHELTDKIFASDKIKPKFDYGLTGFGWYEAAKRQGLLIELPRVQHREAALNLKLTPGAGRAFVFTQALDSDKFEIHRFVVSGNVRELGQFMALVNLYSPDDYNRLLEFQPANEASELPAGFTIFREHGHRGQSIGEYLKQPETAFVPFRSTLIGERCEDHLWVKKVRQFEPGQPRVNYRYR